MATHKSLIRVKKETHDKLRLSAFEKRISIAELADNILSKAMSREAKKKEKANKES